MEYSALDEREHPIDEFKTEIDVSWLSIASLVVASVTSFISYALFVHFGYFNSQHLPTFSETARFYPMSRVFAVGFAVFSALYLIAGQLMSDLLKLDDVPHHRIYQWIPLTASLLCIAMSSVGLHDQPQAHGTFAVLMFVVMLGFCIFIFIAQKQRQMLQCSRMKLILLAVASIMLIIVAALSPIEDETLAMSYAKALSEYVLAFSLFLCIAVWKTDLSSLNVTFVVCEYQ